MVEIARGSRGIIPLDKQDKQWWLLNQWKQLLYSEATGKRLAPKLTARQGRFVFCDMG